MEELICREGTIHSVIFQNAENGYTVLRLLTEEGEAVTVVGCIPCAALPNLVTLHCMRSGFLLCRLLHCYFSAAPYFAAYVRIPHMVLES